MIRTTRLSFLGVFLLAMCVFFPIVGWPAGLFWLAIIPIAVLVWIVRTQTTVSPGGLDLRSVFSSRHIDWAQVKGLSIPKRGFVRAHLDDDSEVPLPAVSYDRLRDLVDAAGGRIPDPFALPEAADTGSDAPVTGAAEHTAPESADDTATEGPRRAAAGDIGTAAAGDDAAVAGGAAAGDTEGAAAEGSSAARGDSGTAPPAPKTTDTGTGPASERE
ncbi:PH domain-containing protein [Nocardia sp. NPDC001965]